MTITIAEPEPVCAAPSELPLSLMLIPTVIFPTKFSVGCTTELGSAAFSCVREPWIVTEEVPSLVTVAPLPLLPTVKVPESLTVIVMVRVPEPASLSATEIPDEIVQEVF